jgi:biopolymer transport protein ExbB/TolQ
MFTKTNLNNAMRAICSALQVPVTCVLLILVAITLIIVGSLIVELIVERRHLKVHMPKLIDEIKAGEIPIEESIRKSGLLKRQKKALIELTAHQELTNFMREALAVRLLQEEQSHYDIFVRISDTIIKIGPALGLLGTLIPLGPGILALGQGDTYTLSQSMLIAFDTTILGLACAVVSTVISTIRKKWYANYNSILETIMECILEVEKSND